MGDVTERADATPDASPDPIPPVSDETGPSLVFDEKVARHSVLEDVLGILTGTFAASFGLHLLNASDAVTGGTAGLSLLLGYASGWAFPLVFVLVNLPFAALAIWKKGWDFTIRTVIAIGLVSAFSALHAAMIPLPGIQPIYGTLAGNLFSGIGLLIVFRHRGSLGGINVLALLLQERSGVRAGWTLMAFDVVIVSIALSVMPWQNVLLSAAGVVLLNLVLALNHRPGRYIGR